MTECPSLPGCISQGKTEDEAIANIREAIRGYIAALEEDGIPVESVETNEKRETEYDRYVRRKIEAGSKDAAEGRTFSNRILEPDTN